MDLDTFVARALEEDVGPGDLTTEACVPAAQQGTADILAREPLVVAGHAVACRVFDSLGARYEPVVQESSTAEPGAVIAEVSGPTRAILTGERLALNLLMRLSGIATRTRRHVEAAGGAFHVVDTRKTTALHRALEKHAVRCGGGRNHRFALYDGILIKENHIRAAGGIEPAVRAARTRAHHLLRVQVEVTTAREAREAVRAGADALLLDNMDNDTLAAIARDLGGEVRLEASGNMDAERLEQLRALAHPPHLVSVGGLVHRARWVDLSLLLRVPG